MQLIGRMTRPHICQDSFPDRLQNKSMRELVFLRLT